MNAVRHNQAQKWRDGPAAPLKLSRRRFFNWAVQGLGATAMTTLLGAQPHRVPRARCGINICLVGGLSQIDSFDYKPDLARHHGQSPSIKNIDPFFGKIGRIRKNDWAFRQHGQSGLWVSELFPHLASVADELTVIRSMYADTGNHTPALFLHNSGFPVNGFPSLGSWLSYGLGTVTESLPAFVVLPDRRGAPSGGASSWTSGFLPATHQGVAFEGGAQPVRDLFPPGQSGEEAVTAGAELLNLINGKQLARLGGAEDMLSARMRSYELAARMQLSVPDAADISSEPESVTRLYGLGGKMTGDFAHNCILARRLLERGVRFVQLYSGGPLGGNPRTSWDGHEKMVPNHTREAARIDQPVAALLKDLKQRGMLEDTLVTFTTEFGRTPFTQSPSNTLGDGRDHNHPGFTVWMAGGGARAGTAYGATDEIGYRAVENRVSWHDFHATVLHLFGLDHEQLSFYHNGIQRRLTNVHGHVLHDLIG